MNEILEKIIEEIEDKFTYVPIDFEDNSWRKSIPPKSGWYLIQTNTPTEVLKSVGSPQYRAHIDLPKTIESVSKLIEIGATIHQSGNDCYVVYNGEATNLKARAREHLNGHGKTFCLGLVNYPVLHRYFWRFCYAPASECRSLEDADKVVRVLFEQVWRAKHGWPILCKK